MKFSLISPVPDQGTRFSPILTVLFAGVMAANSGCQQESAPPNRASLLADARVRAAAAPRLASGSDQLVITASGERNPESGASYVHLRVVQEGMSVLPSEGACIGKECDPALNWAETDPGVFVYAASPPNGARSIRFTVDRGKKPELVFSTTAVSGLVTVEWHGETRQYDLYQTEGLGLQHPPLKLDAPLREEY